MNQGDHLLLVGNRAFIMAHSHATEPDGRDFQVIVSKCALLHLLNSSFYLSCLLSLRSRSSGSSVILTPTARAGAGASNRGSRRIVPVKYSDGPFPEGCEPLLLMSMCSIPPSCLQKQRGMFSVWC